MGFLRTHARIATYFFWTNMQQDIKLFIQRYQICQQVTSIQLHPTSFLHPLPNPNQVWENVAMDFITKLPLS